MPITMFDDTDLSLVPADAEAVAAYVDGRFANIDEAKQKFPNAHILPIAVFARDHARALDDEPGDATNEQAPGWFKAQPPHPDGLKYVFYTSASNIAALVQTLSAAGIKRSDYLIWSAHFTNTPHICGPTTCGFPQADGTQWTDKALGRSLDESLLSTAFFPAARPKPDTGTATAHVVCHLGRKENVWEVHGTAGAARFFGPDRLEEAVIGVNLKTGRWHIHRKGTAPPPVVPPVK